MFFVLLFSDFLPCDELYVMLMLMRSEDNATPSVCEDTDVKVVCAVEAAAGEYDKCPAACRESASDNEEPTVVKSGDLAVTATPATDRKVIINAVSDLDTLKFKTSEEVSITKVTLEKYGYASGAAISGVRLEDADGNVIATAKNLNSRDQVTLSIDKKYRNVDGSLNATIVIDWDIESEAAYEALLWGNIGFKVIDVTSTAKNVNLDDYTPYTYDIVYYDAVNVSLDDKDSPKDYNYEEWEFYQVAKFKVKAANSALLVNGFTLTNLGDLDLEDFLDDVEVLVNGTAVKSSYTLDEDKLTVSFNWYEIATKDSATFTVNVSLADFDEYGDYIQMSIASSADVKMTEKKTGARVSVALPEWEDENHPYVWSSHAFAWSKIRLSSKKLWSVDAAQWSDDVVVLEWEIELTEGLDRVSFNVVADYSVNENIIDSMRLVVAGEEYDAHKDYDTNSATFSFSNVEIEKAWKVQILIDIDDDATPASTITFSAPTSINKNIIANGTARYADAKSTVLPTEVVGSISFATKVTVQASRASLENTLSKDVQFVMNETSKKTVFDGTYTAKKGDVYLRTVAIEGTYDADTYGDLTFYVFVDGNEVATLDAGDPEYEFKDILVKAGNSVKVKVEAEAYPEAETPNPVDFEITLSWVDENDNEAGKASEDLVGIKFVEKGSVIVSTTTAAKDTILLMAKGSDLAKFTVKPSNSNEGLYLENLTLSIAGVDDDNAALKVDDLRVKIGGIEYDPETTGANSSKYLINEELPVDWLEVVVTLKALPEGEVTLSVTNANDADSRTTKSFTKMYADSLVYITSQEKDWDVTQYTLGVDKYDEDTDVTGVRFYTGADCSGELDTGLWTTVEDGDKFSIVNGGTAQTIKCVEWNGVKYKSSDYADYFKVGGKSWMVFSNN